MKETEKETGKEAEKDCSTAILNQRFHLKDAHGAISMPIYAGAAFEFDTAEAMEQAFLGKSGMHTYSRISNPTVEAFEERVKQISGAEHVLAVSSGMAAISNTFLNIAFAGGNIVTTSHLFGNTFSLFYITLKAFGVEVRFCDMLNPAEVDAHIDDKTCAVFAEIITNPHMEVADLKALSQLAHKKNVPLVADSTIVPWPHFNGKRLGVDIEVASGTKYVSGGATSIGGLILDHQTFDWSKSPRLGELSKTAGKAAFTTKLRGEISRNIGAYMAPQTAHLQSLGLETLSLRFERSSRTCKQLAQFLQTVPGVTDVHYNGLPTDPFYKLSCEQFGEYPGSMLTFALKDRAACFKLMNKLQVIRRATNIYDNKSLIIHPLSTIYGTLSDELKKLVCVPANMLRLSVGLENVDDLKADILQGMK